MTGELKRILVPVCGLALVCAAVVSTVLFSLSGTWVRARVIPTVALYLLSLPFLEFGGSGRWFPQFSVPRDSLRGLLRVLAGISGSAFLLLAVGLCFAFGSGILKVTEVGFVFGVYCLALSLIRVAITGRWFPGASKTPRNSEGTGYRG